MPEFEARKVTLNETDNEDYTKRTLGEWQIVHVPSDTVVMRIPWSSCSDASEYPERYFHEGPEAIEIDEANRQIVIIDDVERPEKAQKRPLPPDPS